MQILGGGYPLSPCMTPCTVLLYVNLYRYTYNILPCSLQSINILLIWTHLLAHARFIYTMAIRADPQVSRQRKRSSLTSDVHGMFYYYSII